MSRKMSTNPSMPQIEAMGKHAEKSYKDARAKADGFVLNSASVTTWQELPRGKDPWKIWYNHAIIPLYAVSVVAAGLCSFFMYKYFTQNVEIAWGKEMRGTYDHTGLSTAKADSHTRRLLYPGMRERNKHNIKIFPFNFVPMNDIAEKRKIDYPDME